MKRMFDEKEIKELGAEGAVGEIAGGNVENAKPLYYHPVIVYRTGPSYVRVSFWIINNSSLAFDKASFKSFLAGLDDSSIRLNVTGATKEGEGKVLIVSDVRTLNASWHQLEGLYADNGEYASTSESLENIIDSENAIVVDSVNKIN